MKELDDTTRQNLAAWEREADQGGRNSTPWLDLDVAAYQAFSAGRRRDLPKPYCGDSPEGILMRNAKGKDVLCLASGGGQQSAQFGLLGARVTVQDFCAGQLRADQEAAKHYGYDVHTVQRDMRDLSAFESASFDYVIQGVSMTFVPDVREVYREVFRVLRPSGLYAACHCNPATYPICFDGPGNGWDGAAYRIAEPYTGGPILITSEGAENMRAGRPTGEHRHLYRDIFNGLIESGFVIAKVWDSLWREWADEMPVQGTHDHLRAFEAYFSVLARKPAETPTPLTIGA